jgi:hypothetical protein
MDGPGWLRFMVYGFIAGALLGFGGGCGYAHIQNTRVIERMQAEDPNAHVCGLMMFAELAVSLAGAVAGGLLGVAAGAAVCAACKPWSMDGDDSEGLAERPRHSA